MASDNKKENEIKPRTEAEYKQVIEDRDKTIQTDQLRIASYVTLTDGKDIELIKRGRQLESANKEIAELREKVARLEAHEAELTGQIAYLSGRAAPVIRFEKTLLGRGMRKIYRLLRRKKNASEENPD